ncbi:Alpha/beta hydrolase family protein [Phycisphaerae bacterium RAS1]|nr:Alpha/beta hydrolase family protein [Phycisphaerae bacterium RAS1]
MLLSPAVLLPSLVLVMPLIQPPGADAKPEPTGFLFKTVSIGTETYNYSVYVPPEYDADAAWPCVLFLHGSGERGSDGLLQTEVGIGSAIRRNRALIPAIVVMPQCRPGMTWTGPMAEMALRCVEETSRTYHLDPDRIYLTGLSLGGHGAWFIAARMPDAFAAIVPICGFGEPKEVATLTKMPCWCFHGTADEAVPVQRSRDLIEAVRKAGGDPKFTEIEGGPHNVWDRVYGDPEMWKWLLTQRRGPSAAAPAPELKPARKKK